MVYCHGYIHCYYDLFIDFVEKKLIKIFELNKPFALKNVCMLNVYAAADSGTVTGAYI